MHYISCSMHDFLNYQFWILNFHEFMDKWEEILFDLRKGTTIVNKQIRLVLVGPKIWENLRFRIINLWNHMMISSLSLKLKINFSRPGGCARARACFEISKISREIAVGRKFNISNYLSSFGPIVPAFLAIFSPVPCP